MDLRERLEALGLHKGTSNLASKPANKRRRHGIEDLVAGKVVETGNGACFAASERYKITYQHGLLPLHSFLEQDPSTLARLGKEPALGDVDLRRVLFIDTETTGLAGGTGTYAFLIGIGYFSDDDSFIVEQFFMRDYGEEPAQLAALSERLQPFTAVASFNGKAFDLPLIQTRLALSRMSFGLADAPHLDLLFPTRRIWQKSLSSCALSSLETEVLGVQRTNEDVPGYLIPSLYFDYVRGGDARPLAGVFYHNVQDILSLVTLATLLCGALDDPMGSGIGPLEMLGVARMYEDAGMPDESVQAYHHALQGALRSEHEVDAMRRLSLLLKRSGRRDEASEIWRLMLDDDGNAPLFPYVELAKYYEWHAGNPAEAAQITERALRLASRWRWRSDRHRVTEELEHRLNRLQRKLSGELPAAADKEPVEG